jgi:hypothetical protein
MRNECLLFFGLILPCFAQECITCHRKEASMQTPMSRALESVETCGILRAHPKLAFRAGNYSYEIVRDGNRSVYTVTDGKAAITAPIDWAFGLGAAGQTYVFRRNGAFYESRVSFYQSLNGLDLTMGAANKAPKDLEEAAGRAMDVPGARDCFGCHSTGGVSQGKLHLDLMVPGVQCARCHTSAAEHARAAATGDSRHAGIAKLSRLSTEELSDFCGQCHRTWADIAANGPRGMNNVRFQPYRLANSKCYDAADSRISCVACHDPHQPVNTMSAAYDSKCQACHTPTAKRRGCPVAKKDCVGCHMPKYELQGAHFQFTDHQIRVARPGAPYPN